MKKGFRVALIVAITIGVLGPAAWYASRQNGYPSPQDCLDAYAEARKAGNVPMFLGCLAPPLRQRMNTQFPDADAFAESLRGSMKDVKSWVQLDAVVDGATATVDVDEVLASGTRRIRFHLERTGQNWLISKIEAPKDVPGTIPFGTDVTKVPAD
ncbi:MAG: hypothetical protein KatS3mg105_1691 [Gemmatales bacterium]|nr:MAG: hypothetical protein KatS3mg105_1691 [Gemmatales bacterium]